MPSTHARSQLSPSRAAPNTTSRSALICPVHLFHTSRAPGPVASPWQRWSQCALSIALCAACRRSSASTTPKCRTQLARRTRPRGQAAAARRMRSRRWLRCRLRELARRHQAAPARSLCVTAGLHRCVVAAALTRRSRRRLPLLRVPQKVLRLTRQRRAPRAAKRPPRNRSATACARRHCPSRAAPFSDAACGGAHV